MSTQLSKGQKQAIAAKAVLAAQQELIRKSRKRKITPSEPQKHKNSKKSSLWPRLILLPTKINLAPTENFQD